ncbi:2292_t:CDS:2, partial [Ambispora gerdemannii]
GLALRSPSMVIFLKYRNVSFTLSTVVDTYSVGTGSSVSGVLDAPVLPTIYFTDN